MSRSWRTLLAGALTGATLLLTASPALAEPGAPPSPSRERVVAEVLPAVTYVEVRSRAWLHDRVTGARIGPVSLTGTCSGVMVSPDGHVATAGHCVAEEDIRDETLSELADELVADGVGTRPQMLAFLLIRYDLGGPTEGSPIERTVTVARADTTGQETPMSARIVDALPNDRGDVALLDVDGENFPTIPLLAPGDPVPGTPVTAVGYPAARDRVMDPSREPSWKDGTVSSTQSRDGVPFVEVSADMAPGMSGGPAVDDRGRLVGLNSMGVGDSGAFNYLAPTATLRTMLDRNGVRTDPGPVDLAFRAGLDARAAGENADAVADFTETTRLRPDHAQATKQLALAREAYARDGDVSERHDAAVRFWLVVGGSSVAFLLVAGVTTTILVRRRRRAAEADVAPGGSMIDPPTGPIGPLPLAPGAVPPAGAGFAAPPWGPVPAPRPTGSGPLPVVPSEPVTEGPPAATPSP